MGMSVNQIRVSTRGHVKTILAPTAVNAPLTSLAAIVKLVS